jgi:hypothetical protein
VARLPNSSTGALDWLWPIFPACHAEKSWTLAHVELVVFCRSAYDEPSLALW